MKIILQTENCISCGMCASIAPDLFSVDTGVVTFKKDPKLWTDKDWAKAKEASEACPNGVIKISK